MADTQHLDLLKQGIATWNQWRKDNPRVWPNLVGAALAGASLSGADLSRTLLMMANFTQATLVGTDLSRAWVTGAYLTGATLAGSTLTRATLAGVHLAGASLDGADLSGADLGGADLSRASLVGADLSGANLTGAHLTGAILSGATLSRAIAFRTLFADVDLSACNGLDLVEHDGPSTVGIDTLYRSGGAIPAAFLRGAGVSATFTADARSLVGHPSNSFSCFICHSREDRPFGDRLDADLRAHVVRTWYLPADAYWRPGALREFDRSIMIYDKLVVVCSAHSVQRDQVQREIGEALQREAREATPILFPLLLDDDLVNGPHERRAEWANGWSPERKAEVVNRVVGDFRGWERSAATYDAAFRRLVHALHADE